MPPLCKAPPRPLHKGQANAPAHTKAPLCKGQQRKSYPNHGSLVQRELSAKWLTEGLSVRLPNVLSPPSRFARHLPFPKGEVPYYSSLVQRELSAKWLTEGLSVRLPNVLSPPSRFARHLPFPKGAARCGDKAKFWTTGARQARSLRKRRRERTKRYVTKERVKATQHHGMHVVQNTFSTETAWHIQGILSPCPDETVDKSAPVAANRTRFISRRLSLSIR